MIDSTYLASQRSGMPLSHARCFQQVANDTRAVLCCRSVGRYATGLILEGYASKGFRVKAKSCDWGPMAGFVSSDPRFTRPGASLDTLAFQRASVHAALYGGAAEVPIFISDARRTELEAKSCIQRCGGTINARVYSSISPQGRAMRFVLRRELDAQGASGKHLWAVCYDASETAMPASPELINRATGGRLLPVMALVNPDCPANLRRTYRAAMTSDYDLWAVFPPEGEFEPYGRDRRPVPGSSRFVVPIETFAQHENARTGNITARLSCCRCLFQQKGATARCNTDPRRLSNGARRFRVGVRRVRTRRRRDGRRAAHRAARAGARRLGRVARDGGVACDGRVARPERVARDAHDERVPGNGRSTSAERRRERGAV